MNFSRWLAAAEHVLELPPGQLQQAYIDNLREAVLDTVRESALAVTLLNFAAGLAEGYWTGTATQLLAVLNQSAPANTVHRQTEWPQSPISLSKRLKQLAALLKSQGVDIGFSHGTQRQVEITYLPPGSTRTPDEFDEPDESAEANGDQVNLADCESNQDQGGAAI